jgi:DNA-binding MurR/RpiR family transcriptional regulator
MKLKAETVNSKKVIRPTMASILDIIRDRYSEMTPAFQGIASYVMDHHQELAFASAARVAALAGSSAATVVRFSESLGLSGFSALQAIAREDIQNEVNTVARLERTLEQPDSISLYEAALRTDIANLQAMLARAPSHAFDDAVELLASARCIHLVGLRSTYGLVRHFESYLSWIGRSAHVLSPGIGDLPEQLLAVEPSDVCVAISLRRYTRATMQITEAAKRNGASVIAITDSELSPLATLAQSVLLVPVQFPAFFESKTGVLSVMNALLLGLSYADRQRTLAALRRHERSWLGQETYVHEGYRPRLMADIEALSAGDTVATPSRQPRRNARPRARRSKERV